MMRTPCPRALTYIISPERKVSRFLVALGVCNVTVFISALWRRQPSLICDVMNITNNRKPFRTRWKITGGSLSESCYDEPDDDGSHNKEVSRADSSHPNKTSDSSSTHGKENNAILYTLSFRSLTIYTGTCSIKGVTTPKRPK